MAMTFCKCGLVFANQRQIVEHVGICNPHWPRTTPEDQHLQVTEKEWTEITKEKGNELP